jgi:hypothetical protein
MIRLGAPQGPVHTRLFEALVNDGLAAGLDHAGAHEESQSAEYP